jgi:hypothetical protein
MSFQKFDAYMQAYEGDETSEAPLRLRHGMTAQLVAFGSVATGELRERYVAIFDVAEQKLVDSEAGRWAYDKNAYHVIMGDNGEDSSVVISRPPVSVAGEVVSLQGAFEDETILMKSNGSITFGGIALSPMMAEVNAS